MCEWMDRRMNGWMDLMMKDDVNGQIDSQTHQRVFER